MIKQYENNFKKDVEVQEERKLYKTKDAVKQYPVLTIYALEKAVREKKLSYTKIGNTNYFYSTDLENFIDSQRYNVEE